MRAELPPIAAERLALLPVERRLLVLKGLGEARAAAMRHHWPFWARDGQQGPAGNWRIWLLMAGRGFGKTRAGAEWVRSIAEHDGSARIALVGATLDEARGVMVEGPSGLLAIAPPGGRPAWEPSLRRLRWESGAQARIFSAAEPDSLRGPEHSHGWCDEIAKWPSGMAAWDNLAMGLRLGERPRIVATTTPRPVMLLRRLLAQPDVAVTRGRTTDNRAHLPTDYLAAMEAGYAGSRLGRQELDGELIEEVDGALWSRALIGRCRVGAIPDLARVVIGVDPPAGAGAASDACGIVAAALGRDGIGYVLEDASVQGLAPEGWAAAVAAAAARHGADRVIAEANNGGAMVESVLRAADAALPVRLVHAARGKSARAEPVSVLYERGQVRHAGAFPALEDEMAGLLVDGGYAGPGRSPARAFGTLQYLPTGADGTFPTSEPEDLLIDLVQSLRAPYRQGASFVMNSATLAVIRKMKTAEGQFLWSPGLVAGQPDALLGYPVVEAEDMPDIGSGTTPIAFGNFQAGYLIAERGETAILRDPFSHKPFVHFYATRRIGGSVANSDAIKLIRFSTS